MGNKLIIYFDRKLLLSQPDPADPYVRDTIGINQYTFVVQYGGLQQDVEFLSSVNDTPQYQEPSCAVFEFAEALLGPRPGDPPRKKVGTTLAENSVFITLKCDFIMDCHNNPVDGNHLRGKLPSGDGTPGGVFESWFSVIAERDEDQAR